MIGLINLYEGTKDDVIIEDMWLHFQSLRSVYSLEAMSDDEVRDLFIKFFQWLKGTDMSASQLRGPYFNLLELHKEVVLGREQQRNPKPKTPVDPKIFGNLKVTPGPFTQFRDEFAKRPMECATQPAANATNPDLEISAHKFLGVALKLRVANGPRVEVEDYIDLAYYHAALIEPAPEGAERMITIPALEDNGPPLPLAEAHRLALETRCKYSRI